MNRDEFESKVLELWTKSKVPLTEAVLAAYTEQSPEQLVGWLDELLDCGFLDIGSGAGALQYTVPGQPRPAKGTTNLSAFVKKRALLLEAKRRILARRGHVEAAPKKPAKAKSSAKKQQAPQEPSLSPRTEVSASPASLVLSVLDEDDVLGKEDNDEPVGPSVAKMVGRAAMFAGGKAMVALDKPLTMMDKPVGKGEKSMVASGAVSLLGPIGWLYAGSFREAVPATMAQIAAFYLIPTFLLTPFLLIGAAASAAMGATYAWQYNRKKKRTPLFLKGKKKKPKELDSGEDS